MMMKTSSSLMTMVSDDFVGSISEPRSLLARQAGQGSGLGGVGVVICYCTVANLNILGEGCMPYVSEF